MFTRDDLARVAAIAVAHDLLVLADEVWGELMLPAAAGDDREFVSMASLLGEVPGLRERLIVVSSPSKAFNVAGLNLAWAYVPDRDLRRAFVSAGKDKAELGTFGVVALKAAYAEGEPWRQRLVEYVAANRDRAAAALDAGAPELRYTVPDASYLMWIDCRALGEKSPATFFERAGVGFSDGATFGARGFVRLNLACTAATIDAIVERVVAAVAAGRGAP